MKDKKNKHQVVTLEEFLQELQRELHYHSDGGTSYRRETAEISIKVANKVRKVTPFIKLEEAKEIVHHLFNNIDQHRAEDVAKMMYSIAVDIHYKSNTSDEIRQYVQEKSTNRKPLSFVKIKKKGRTKDDR
jgi:phosphoribosyl-ATP pyrophosphohydrolase